MNSDDSIKGFYYDQQLGNELMSMTLHPNQIIGPGGNDPKQSPNWVNVPASEAEENPSNPEYPYSKYPIARAVLNEEFQVSMANEWTGFEGGDMITQLFNQAKPFAPYASELQSIFDKINKQSQATEDSNKLDTNFGKTVANIATKASAFARDFAGGAAEYLNRALVIQGNRFSYYSGTGIAFNNLGMRFTLFPDWLTVYDRNIGREVTKFMTVHDQLDMLYPYSLGKYIPFRAKESGSGPGESAPPQNQGTFGRMINEFIGWQTPPGGFQAAMKDIDLVQKGTLKLKFGSFFCLENLVIRDLQLSFSKQMAKVPPEDWKEGDGSIESKFRLSPLYCEVQLSLHPATKYSDASIKRFTGGEAMTTDIARTEERLFNKLKGEKEKFEKKKFQISPSPFVKISTAADLDAALGDSLPKLDSPTSIQPGQSLDSPIAAPSTGAEDLAGQGLLNDLPTA